MAVAKADPGRKERRRQQKEIADSLRESGALDEIFARIDAGEPLTGQAGLLKASLERGLVVRPAATQLVAKLLRADLLDDPSLN